MPRKTFPCGHSGKGQYCHRCEQERKARELERAKQDRRADERRARAEYARQIEARWSLDLRGIPERIIRDADKTASELSLSALPSGSQRMHFDRTCISVPLAGEYRLLVKDCGDRLEPRFVVSHEEYNRFVRNRAIKGW